MSILAIVAHPDDADIFCGGTLAKHADRGDDVQIVHMTSGEYGGIDTTEDELVSVRQEEARNSAAELGCGCDFLEFNDGRIEQSLENRLVIVDVIRNHQPDVILTHFNDDMHPDHRATSRLVSNAYYMASLPLVETEYDPHDPDNVYYFGKPTSAFDPSVYIDISDYQARKERAIDHHDSQVEFLENHGGIDAEFDNLIDGVRAEARVLGKRTGVEYAEGFAPLHDVTTDYLE
ncbi:PIG-L family deacetylase [Natronolimnobius sp. AArcel1]|uniref:PIG-L deacetylase family protein n=1 Tax=Natronolimnobius sp. AArcel1 TaxID=1679093 RepID=UPI0013EAFC31|nr:PIG-L family deacetylase [Natronolimnobius sp. AArcel1]NGM70640.1 PIG-L family deacetylase [Natronolimnobius sp. AArcel1]